MNCEIPFFSEPNRSTSVWPIKKTNTKFYTLSSILSINLLFENVLFKQKGMLLFLSAIRSPVFILLPGADQTPMQQAVHKYPGYEWVCAGKFEILLPDKV